MKTLIAFSVALLTLGAAGAGALGAFLAAPPHEVTMPGQLFSPGRADVLVGQSISWRNTDRTTHAVVADDGSFDSGDLTPGATFSRTFAAAGGYRYHCRIHRFMRGLVVVSQIVLRGPERPVLAGSTARLTGIVPSGGGEVTLERSGKVVARTTAASDGAFAFDVVAEAGGGYRARAGAASSAEISVPVAPRVTSAAANGSLRVSVSPALPGAWIRIEAYNRERFGWDRFTSVRLRHDSTAVVALVSHRALRLRARVLATNGYADGVSGAVWIGHAQHAHGGGHH